MLKSTPRGRPRQKFAIGIILEAECVTKSDKLLKFLVDDGIEKCTILSGTAKHFTPEEMLGRQVTSP